MNINNAIFRAIEYAIFALCCHYFDLLSGSVLWLVDLFFICPSPN